MCLIFICDVLCIITSVMYPIMILVRTDHPCLRAVCHMYNMSITLSWILFDGVYK
jgi:hypothetical protein